MQCAPKPTRSHKVPLPKQQYPQDQATGSTHHQDQHLSSCRKQPSAACVQRHSLVPPMTTCFVQNKTQKQYLSSVTLPSPQGSGVLPVSTVCSSRSEHSSVKCQSHTQMLDIVTGLTWEVFITSGVRDLV